MEYSIDENAILSIVDAVNDYVSVGESRARSADHYGTSQATVALA